LLKVNDLLRQLQLNHTFHTLPRLPVSTLKTQKNATGVQTVILDFSNEGFMLQVLLD
jgi:hypothetical protein